MLEELLPLLACPVCKGGIEAHGEKIVCPACQLAYPIVDGIPIMLRDKAEHLAP